MDKNWVIVGRFGRPHGIKGWIKVISFTEPHENISLYAPWYLHTNKQWRVLKIRHTNVQNKLILAQVEDCFNRDQVAYLTNQKIAIRRDQLLKLKPGEYYWYQLMGMQVINQQGNLLGTIAEIMPTGANDVLVVMGEKRYLIPYVLDKFILNVDDRQRFITVDWDVDF